MVRDLAMSMLWLQFNSWPGNFRRPRVQPKKKKSDHGVVSKMRNMLLETGGKERQSFL